MADGGCGAALGAAVGGGAEVVAAVGAGRGVALRSQAAVSKGGGAGEGEDEEEREGPVGEGDPVIGHRAGGATAHERLRAPWDGAGEAEPGKCSVVR